MDLSAAAIAGYARLASEIEACQPVDNAALYAPVLDLLPHAPARVLDVGAGPGHDAAWLASQGHDVTAVEPVDAFRKAISQRLPQSGALDARLPELHGVAGSYDLITVNGVWQHLEPDQRPQAWGRLAALTRDGGRLILSLRHGRARRGRPVAAIDPVVELRHAAQAGLSLTRRVDTGSHLPENAADGVTWTWLALAREVPQ